MNGDTEGVRKSIEHHASEKEKEVLLSALNQKDKKGRTPIFYSVY